MVVTDAVFGQDLEHLAGYAGVSRHADANQRDHCQVRYSVDDDVLEFVLLGQFCLQRISLLVVTAEGYCAGSVCSHLLRDHVHIDPQFSENAETFCNSLPVRRYVPQCKDRYFILDAHSCNRHILYYEVFIYNHFLIHDICSFTLIFFQRLP